MRSIRGNKQSGAVSLFVVVFAMLIITVITISFLRLMISDQNQASDNDLSQSAYDSAQAGVEDAKRALLNYQRVCSATPGACAGLADQLSSDVCNAAVLVDGIVSDTNVVGGTPSNPGEILVQQSTASDDSALNQAYTCVTIELKTPDYVGNLTSGESQLVPLIGNTDDDGAYDTVNISWFSRDDVNNATGTVDLYNASGANKPLVDQSNWTDAMPPILRTQLIQFGNDFTLDSFDAVSGGQSNANTIFFYPTSAAGSANPVAIQGVDLRSTGGGDEPDADDPLQTPYATHCEDTVGAGGPEFACTMSIALPEPIGGLTASGDRTAFLRLTPYYNGTDYQVTLSRGGSLAAGGSLVRFKDVQPEVDSTGRANDLFRRIVSRVDLYDTSFAYPEATIDLTGNFCKDFGVTVPDPTSPDPEVQSGYIAGSCTP